MIPAPESFGHVDSTAERRVAELLAQADLGVPTTCLYSLRLPVHEYKRMSEIDFLVLWDDTVLAIEVKGGRLARRAGLWTFTDRYGVTFEKREGPFDQASSAMFALESRLRERIAHLDVAFGFLVVTPDQQLQQELEWAPEQYAGSRCMSVTRMKEALARARAFAHERHGRRVAGGARRELLTILRPDFDRVPTLASSVAGLEQEYIRLAERQYDLLLGAERNPRIVCTGGAGSGKTLLAVETARRAAAGGASVTLTCRSPLLARLLRGVTAGSGVLCGTVPEVEGSRRADVLVVDEAQDLMDVESLLRLDALVIDGLSLGRWRIFCDPNNQAKVDGTFDRHAYQELAAGSVAIDLPYNCRNTSNVVRQTQQVTGADLGVAKAGAGPVVDYVRHSDGDGAARLLDAQLKRLRREEVDLADVAVITTKDDAGESCAVGSKAFRTGHLVAEPDPELGHPGVARLVTTAQIKGLEAGHVCVVDVEDTHEPVALARLYVAMTRPRISLWISLGETAWQQIAQSTERRTGR